jgi:hypothetical protein
MKTSFYKYILLILAACSVQVGLSQSDNAHVLRTGLSGGGVFNLMPTGCEMTSKIGGSGALELDYAYYKSLNTVGVGLRTGLGIGYVNSQYHAEFSQQYTNTDFLNNDINYTTSAVVDITQHQLHATIPLMFALRADGLVWNIGLNLQAAFFQQGTQQLSDPLIEAYYPAYNVVVSNELITGKLQEDQLLMPTQRPPLSFSCLVGTEIGYEHSINSKTGIGVMAYVNVGVWNSLPKATNTPVIQVDPISDSKHPVPAVSVNDAYCSLVNSSTPLQFGVKLYYAFTL